jgi:hypothetical protein
MDPSSASRIGACGQGHSSTLAAMHDTTLVECSAAPFSACKAASAQALAAGSETWLHGHGEGMICDTAVPRASGPPDSDNSSGFTKDSARNRNRDVLPAGQRQIVVHQADLRGREQLVGSGLRHRLHGRSLNRTAALDGQAGRLGQSGISGRHGNRFVV